MMFLITFRSITPAQRGEGVLRRAGFDCKLQRTPRWMEEKGCGYSLAVGHTDGHSAVELLRRNEIPFRRVYQRKDDGTLEELGS